MNKEEERLVAENLQIIRECLKKAFPEFEITRDKSNPSMDHRFEVVKFKPFTSYKLQVWWPRISDKGNTPVKTRQSFNLDKVAENMEVKKGEYFYW